MHDFNHDSDSTHIRDAQGHGSETARAIRLAATGWDCKNGGLFPANGDWQKWLHESFEKTVGAHFISVHTHAGQMQVREIAALDAGLDLPGQAISRSSGEALLQCLLTTRSSRLAKKLASQCPSPQLATASAVQAVEFTIPLRQALLSYLFLEWIGGNPKGTIDIFLKHESALSDCVGRVVKQSFEQFPNAFSA